MSESRFYGTEFAGTNIGGSYFRNFIFQNAIFTYVIADQADFIGCKFFHCIPDIEYAKQIIPKDTVRNSVIQLKKVRFNRL